MISNDGQSGTPFHRANTNKWLPAKSRDLVRVSVGILLALLFLGATASMIHAPGEKGLFSALGLKVEELVGVVGERLETWKNHLDQWLAAAGPREAQLAAVQTPPSFEHRAEAGDNRQNTPALDAQPLALAKPTEWDPGRDPDSGAAAKPASVLIIDPQPAAAKEGVLAKLKGRSVVIQYGSTVGNIAGHFYGADSTLGMDLIKEFNPHIEDLDWVFAGQGLRLPPLTRETLLRKQSDGSYRLILESFPGAARATKLAEVVRSQGYQVIITTRNVSDNLLLHRVEVAGLKSLEAANQAWETATANRWISFSEQPQRRKANE
jgi:hypothetical protein